MNLTKSQKDFIGTIFTTPKGGKLTVVGVSRIAHTAAVFSLRCSLCSEDEELWPKGSITSPKGSLVKGKVPCGCSSFTNWTECQNTLRVLRECKTRGYVFKGWYKGYKKTFTRLILENPLTGNTWNTAVLGRFVKGECYDPKDTSIRDEEHISEFIKAGFSKDCTFWRSPRLNSDGYPCYWYYTCPVCSKDDFVENKVCNGVFEATTNTLKSGSKACRCNTNNYRWNSEERQYQLSKILREETGKFLGWEDGSYTSAQSKFGWVCSEGHTCKTTVGSFLKGSRCPSCSVTGYDTSKNGTLYLVEWYGFGKSYLKKGITNKETLTRVRGQYSKGKLDYKILREISGCGKLIQCFESKLNSKYKGSSCPREWLPDGYTETVENTPENYENLMEDFDELENLLKVVDI